MFTDMEYKRHPDDQIRLELTLKRGSGMHPRTEKVKASESPPGGNGSPIKHVPKQGATLKRQTLGLKPGLNTTPIYFGRESRYVTKQQQQQALRVVAKSKRATQLQRDMERSPQPPLKVPKIPSPQSLAYGYIGSYGIKPTKGSTKGSKASRGVTSKLSKASKSSKTTKTCNQTTLTMRAKNTEVSTDRQPKIVPQGDYSDEHHSVMECNRPAEDTCGTGHKESLDMRSTPPDTTVQRSLGTCLAEFARKEYYYMIQQQVEKAIKVMHRRLFMDRHHSAVFQSFCALSSLAMSALQSHKIFLIRGDIPYLEDAMKTRGWVQKYESSKTRNIPYGSTASIDAPSLGNLHLTDGTLNEKAIIFHILRHVPPDFVWDCRNEFVDWNSNIKQETLLNRFQKSFVYTSKLGMAAVLEDAHWNFEDKVCSVQYPRSYNVGRDRSAFIEDYRRTAAVSLLKWFVEQIQKGVDLTNRGMSPISTKQIEFAIKRCEEVVSYANNDHLDSQEPMVSTQEWDRFIEDYVKAVHQGNGIVEQPNGPLAETENPLANKRAALMLHPLMVVSVNGKYRIRLRMLYVAASAALKRVKSVDPQYDLNGMRNIWILKPSELCCGSGIIMTHKMNHIIKRMHDSPKDYYIVQKYIEKPLLVQDTKFDIRQWYLVTKSYPLTIWIYNSRPFSFSNYHEAIHICNTAVQCKYAEQKNSVRSMDWDCNKINDYLKKAGYKGEPWYEEVYPKICEAIIATMVAAQQHMDKRRCSFELYGADFVIMDDLSAWLIEINTNPRMHPPSTKVTERLYPEVMESLVKVILDYPLNPSADTGNFVLAYRQKTSAFQPYLGACMYVLGRATSMKQKNLLDQGIPANLREKYSSLEVAHYQSNEG